MRIRTTAGLVTNTIIEHTAAKTGILLARDQFFEIVGTQPGLREFLPILKDEGRVVVRPEFIEASILIARAELGNLPDPGPDLHYANQLLLEIYPAASRDQQQALMHCVRMWKITPGAPSTIEDVYKQTKLPTSVVDKLFLAWPKILDRSFDFDSVEEKDWDSHQPLSILFNCEHLPEDDNLFLDQRFIDYLAVKGESLSRMHWRNFERLCAEFFSRQHKYVRISRMGGDGGIDIRVYPEDDSEGKGPPLVVIQCKRLSDNEYVQIADVKALYEDARWENAKGSLFITTGKVGADNRKVAVARRYKIAEERHVRGLTRSMWRQYHEFTPVRVDYPFPIPPLERFVSDEESMRSLAAGTQKILEIYEASQHKDEPCSGRAAHLPRLPKCAIPRKKRPRRG